MRSLRPLSRWPIPSTVDHAQNHDAFASTRQRLNCISEDVGKSANRFFVCSCNTATPARGDLSESLTSCVYPLKSSAGRHRIVRRNVRDSRIQIFECALGPNNGTHAFAFDARPTVARKRRIACLCETTRPACMSSRPRRIPSIMASSRSTKSAIASPARKDLVRRVRSARRPSRFFTSGEIRTVSVVLFMVVHKITHCHRRIQIY
jgi:hypothetical protein